MKITTGFSPIEASFLLQMCHHSSEATPVQPKIPIQIPQPDGWGILESHRLPSSQFGFTLWQNQINAKQYAMVFQSPSLDIPSLATSKSARMAPAQICFSQSSMPLSSAPNAKCNADSLEKFQALLPLLLKTFSQFSDAYELYLSGHGQAGAMATFFLSALYQHQLPFLHPDRLKTYLYGSPRIGNAAFTNPLNQRVFNNEKIDSLAFHLINTDDVVCELPQNLSLTPSVKRQVSSFRIHLIDLFSKMLYAGASGANSEPYKNFGTPVLLTGNGADQEQSPSYQHDRRRYFHLMQQNFPV